jgi:hypothetical protein
MPTSKNPPVRTSVLFSFWRQINILASFIVSKGASVLAWLSKVTKISQQIIAGLGLLAVFGFGATFLRLDEYAIADGIWVILFLAFALKILVWNVSPESPIPPGIAKAICLLLSIGFCIFLLRLTDIRRGDSAWSNLYQKPEQFKTDQYRKKMLIKYPLGYAIFDIDYQDHVSSYDQQGLNEIQLDWKPVRITRNTPSEIELRLPDVSDKNGQPIFRNTLTDGPRQVGDLGGTLQKGIMVVGEILSIKNNAIVFLVGFSRVSTPDIIFSGNDQLRLAEGKPLEIKARLRNLTDQTVATQIVSKYQYIIGSSVVADKEEADREDRLWNAGLAELRITPHPTTLFSPQQEQQIIITKDQTAEGDKLLAKSDIEELEKNRGEIYFVISVRYDDSKGPREYNVCRHASLRTQWRSCIKYNGISTTIDW